MKFKYIISFIKLIVQFLKNEKVVEEYLNENSLPRNKIIQNEIIN